MKQRLAKLTRQINPLLRRLYELRLFIFIIVFLGIYTFLVVRVNKLVQSEPDATTVNAQTVKRLTVDKAALDKIKQLQSQNIQVQSLFEQARHNPFTE